MMEESNAPNAGYANGPSADRLPGKPHELPQRRLLDYPPPDLRAVSPIPLRERIRRGDTILTTLAGPRKPLKTTASEHDRPACSPVDLSGDADPIAAAFASSTLTHLDAEALDRQFVEKYARPIAVLPAQSIPASGHPHTLRGAR